jgi:hypothetical protein
MTLETVEVETPASLATVLIDMGNEYNKLEADFHELPFTLLANLKVPPFPAGFIAINGPNLR